MLCASSDVPRPHAKYRLRHWLECEFELSVSVSVSVSVSLTYHIIEAYWAKQMKMKSLNASKPLKQKNQKKKNNYMKLNNDKFI